MNNDDLRSIVGHTSRWRRWALRRLREMGISYNANSVGNVRLYRRLTQELVSRQKS